MDTMTRIGSWGLRLVSLVLCAACLLSMAGGVAATTDGAETTQVTEVLRYATIVRRSASYSDRSVGRVEDGTCVTVLGQQGSFYRVDLYDMTGYIAASQIIHKDGEYYVNCQPESSETAVITYTDHAQALALRHSLMELAQKQLGKPYIYGSTGTRGFDCSGLMYYLHGQYGITLERGASGQLGQGIVVAREGMQVGDLVFFKEPGETYPCSHVGIYVGNNQIIHAGSGGISYATLEGFYFGEYFLCARRIINTDTAQLQTPPASVNLSRSLLTGSGVSGRTVNYE